MCFRCSRSHIVNPSIRVDAKSVRAFSTPTMQTHSSPSTPTKILHSGASQSSVKSLFAKAPQKAKAKVKKEAPSTRDHSTTDSTRDHSTTDSTHDTPNDPTNDDDLFDKEASDDDEISVASLDRLECSAGTAFGRCSSTRSARTRTRSRSPPRSRNPRKWRRRSPR